MKTGALIILLTMSCLSAFSQNTISGSTIDSITNTNIINTRVTLFNSDTTFFLEERTANNGNFQFNNIPDGNYSIEGFYLDNGLMQVTVNPTVYPNLCDTVIAELHNVNSPYAFVYSSKGTISTSGNGTFGFPALSAGKRYYLVIRHRNGLETWSANPIVIFNNMIYDFTNAQN